MIITPVPEREGERRGGGGRKVRRGREKKVEHGSEEGRETKEETEEKLLVTR